MSLSMPDLLCGSEHLRHRGGQLDPVALLDFKLPAPARGELVVFGAPIVLRSPPASLDPAAPLQAMQGRIQRALLNAQHIARNLLDAFGYGPAMLWLQHQRLQNQDVQSALRKFDAMRGGQVVPFHFYK